MSAHPHFVSPQPWFTRLEDGLAAARAAGRRVLVQHGRQACGGCRALVEKTVGKEEIRAYLDGHFVCVASDADAPEPSVTSLLAQVPQHTRTPVCLYLGPGGELLHATSGGRPAAVFLADLIEVTAR